MSVWSIVATKIKEIINRMLGKQTIEQTLHVAPVISSQMEQSIKLWSDMYKNQAEWLHEPNYADPTRVVSLGLPAMIASEKARTVLIEWKTEITTPTKIVEEPNPNYQKPEGDFVANSLKEMQPETITKEVPIGSTARAEFLNEQFDKFRREIRRQLEYGVAKGGFVIKPYPIKDKSSVNGDYILEFDFIQADNFYPLAFDASGRITDAAFIQTKLSNDIVYRRLEYHKWTGRTVQIINKAYKSTNRVTDGADPGLDLGHEIPLTEVPEWAELEADTKIDNVDRPLFAYFKMPEANTIDTTSPLGVSGYSRAVQLIKDADMQYSRTLWEFEAGEMAINVDRDALQFLDEANQGLGKTVPNKLQNRLYRRLDISQDELYQEFAPTLRDISYINGLNVILMRIEDVCGISRGTLSDAAVEAKTATELKILKQRSYVTNQDIQKSLEYAIKDVIYIMDMYCDLYNITEDGDYEVSFDWDDSLIVDTDEELGKRITLQQNGITSKLENRMWYFGETEAQAKEALQQVQQESIQAVQDNLIAEASMRNVKDNNPNADDNDTSTFNVNTKK